MRTSAGIRTLISLRISRAVETCDGFHAREIGCFSKLNYLRPERNFTPLYL